MAGARTHLGQRSGQKRGWRRKAMQVLPGCRLSQVTLHALWCSLDELPHVTSMLCPPAFLRESRLPAPALLSAGGRFDTAAALALVPQDFTQQSECLNGHCLPGAPRSNSTGAQCLREGGLLASDHVQEEGRLLMRHSWAPTQSVPDTQTTALPSPHGPQLPLPEPHSPSLPLKELSHVPGASLCHPGYIP